MKSEEREGVFLKSLRVLALGGYSFFTHRQNFSFKIESIFYRSSLSEKCKSSKISLSLLKPIDYVNSY